MTDPLQHPHILIVDDDLGLLILMAETLRTEGYEVATAGSGAAALAALERRRPDLMLLDLKLKDVGGPALLKQIRPEEAPVPFLVVTGQGDEKVAVEMMKEGALDYVMKDSALLDLLPSVVKRAILAIEQNRTLVAMQKERQRLEKELLEVSERERHRIGEDLHDGLGQQLTAIELLCTTLKEDVAALRHPRLVKQVEQVSQMLREAITHVRALARGLVPVRGESDALQVSLLELVDRTNSLGRMKCRFECPSPALITDGTVAGHFYRIAQEAMNNAMKHSQAKEIVVRLAQSKGVLELQVRDNGRGLPKNPKNAGMGLQVMRHRASVIGADLSIDSEPGQGVIITCTLRKIR
ncbi:MAG TPA: response regulator [Opitutaceae bacterium]|nr:response regulator [Opitutaceae bacterium]